MNERNTSEDRRRPRCQLRQVFNGDDVTRRFSAITIARWRSCVTNDAFDRSVIAASRIRSGARNYTATSVARHDNHDDDARSHHHGDGDARRGRGVSPPDSFAPISGVSTARSLRG